MVDSYDDDDLGNIDDNTGAGVMLNVCPPWTPLQAARVILKAIEDFGQPWHGVEIIWRAVQLLGGC